MLWTRIWHLKLTYLQQLSYSCRFSLYSLRSTPVDRQLNFRLKRNYRVSKYSFKHGGNMSIYMKVLLLPYFQYKSLNITILTFLKIYFVLWENEGQHWVKNEPFFLLYELLHQQARGFYSFFSHWNAFYQNSRKTVLAFFFFFFCFVFVQNVMSKFIKVLPKKLNNPLLEKSWARSYEVAC